MSIDIDRVIQNLWKAVRLHPKSLLSKYTQLLAIKVLLIKLLSPRITNRLLQFSRQISKALKPQIKQQETL